MHQCLIVLFFSTNLSKENHRLLTGRDWEVWITPGIDKPPWFFCENRLNGRLPTQSNCGIFRFGYRLKVSFIVPPSGERCGNNYSLFNCLKKRDLVSSREIAKILGNLAWAIKAIPFAQSNYRNLQLQYIEGCKHARESLNSAIILDVKWRQDLSWWIANVKECNGSPMSATDPDLTIFSDASLLGWGGGSIKWCFIKRSVDSWW